MPPVALLPGWHRDGVDLKAALLSKISSSFEETKISISELKANDFGADWESSGIAVESFGCNPDARREQLQKQLGYDIPKDAEVGVDGRDAGTPDDWIPRHPALVRLTGKHPFNCEAPLPLLKSAGFITPVSLHYVRNHGYVPKCDFATWTVEVSGLVDRPMTLSMADILALPPRTIPITLVCAGNRRKEANMVKQTIGFSWGAAGTSTTVWTGALLCDVLRLCGIKSVEEGALHVCFEGQETLPGGGGSKYATSLKREIALDPACDVLLAYEQNGEPLRPDHGFPLRTLIPGYIGGRTVKWLRKITVTWKESDNFYHFNDNRVLPSQVDAERASREGWWYKPDYIINELNIQSVIWQPAHGEVLSLTQHNRPYRISGYAYNGGGRKIIRVELSLDGGDTWEMCDLEHPEKPTEYGKYWCWCFWHRDVAVADLFSTKEVCVRAWDSSMNTQPSKIIWNVMGMLNNCYFRIRVHPCTTKEGGFGLTFEHPTMPANQKGGWMVKEKEEADSEAVAAPAPTMHRSSSTPVLDKAPRLIPKAEVKRHDSEKDCWIIVHNKVYDATPFLEEHPGGAESIVINAGTDCTEEFDAIHSTKAKRMLDTYYIGDLAVGPATPEGSLRGGTGYLSSLSRGLGTPEGSLRGGNAYLPPMAPIHEAAPSVALDPKKRLPFKLIQKDALSRDVRRFRFALPSPDQRFGLPVGKHIFLSATVDGNFVMRAYTPTSSDDDLGHFDLVIKIYFKNVHPTFPDGGVLSQHLESLSIGATVDVKGPVGHIWYQGRGRLVVGGKPRMVKRLTMIAGGTGITPVYQVIKAVLKDAEDATQMSVLYASRTPDDILLREDLEAFEKEHPDRLKVWHTVNAGAPPDWAYSTGFITEAMCRGCLYPGDEDTVALVCGPPPMIKFACLPNLEKMGHTESSILQF